MRMSFRKQAEERPAQPIEVGIVSWQRELNDALGASTSSGKPVFALFQEVPGCAGCKQFGAEVLSDPIVVDAIEAEFVPLLIHNNTEGRDAEVLHAFGEPAWNFQVVRFLNAMGDDLIERRDRVWETGPLVQRMVAALEVAGRPVPTYLRLVEQEHSKELVEAYLAQSCFWVGETELGRIDGVVTTEAGFMEGLEVTRVQFDPSATSLAAVVREAQERGVASAVFVGFADGVMPQFGQNALPIAAPTKFTVAPKRDQKRQIRDRVDFKGLTAGQLTKLNAFLPIDAQEAACYLSPRQRAQRQMD